MEISGRSLMCLLGAMRIIYIIYWHFKIIKLYPFRKYSDTLLGNSEEGEGKGQKPKFLKKSKKSNYRNFQRAGRLKSKAFC